MGWAEDARQRAREAVEAGKVPSAEPREAGPGAAPSEFLETVARGMLVDCMKAAGEIQGLLAPPKIVGPSGQGPARPDAGVVVMATLVRVLHAQAATLDLMLTMLGCRPELRPVGVAVAESTGPKAD